MAESGLTKNQIIAELTRSSHAHGMTKKRTDGTVTKGGSLKEYIPVGKRAAIEQPEFFAHLIAWNQIKGQVRDSKVALPVVSLLAPDFPDEFVDNSLAHLALLPPREFLRAFRFSMDAKVPHRSRVKKLVHAYCEQKERNQAKWQRLAILHRHTLKEIYALSHYDSADFARDILFDSKFPEGSLFEKVKNLPTMSAKEAAATIIDAHLPFLVVQGALGKKLQDPDLVLALIKNMTPTEIVTNTKMLEKLGVKNNPVLRSAYEKGLERAAKSKTNILKTTRAVDAVEDEGLKDKLRGLQEKQLSNLSVEGNWLVLADKSGSMAQAIDVARHVAATLAKVVKGKVWLVFFDTAPQTVDVTGCTLDMIQKATKYIKAEGGTSIGCGLQRMFDSKEEVDGIAVVSDAQENTTPYFPDVYERYCKHFGKELPVYLYRLGNNSNYWQDRDLAKYMRQESQDIQEFDLTKNVDYYSLPNLVATMRTNRYSLVDEIMATRLLSLKEALPLMPFGKEGTVVTATF